MRRDKGAVRAGGCLNQGTYPFAPIMIADLRWHTALLEVVARTWPMLTVSALLQVVVLERASRPARLHILLLAAVSGFVSNSVVAAALFTLPLTEPIAQHLVAHVWLLGAAASFGGFLPTTAMWIVGLRLWRRHRSGVGPRSA